jgi:hypothetical protein
METERKGGSVESEYYCDPRAYLLRGVPSGAAIKEAYINLFNAPEKFGR